MKQTLEEATREYANDCRNRQHHCEPYCIVDFKAGAEWQKEQFPWISVEEQLPPCSDEDLFLLGIDSRGVKNIPDVGYMHSSKDGKPRKDLFVCGELIEVTHWMKVPAFEDILEANRDVLERMKEKGELKYAENNV